MRLTATFSSSGEVTLPLHHNHLLQAAVYGQILQPGLKTFLHDEGFSYGQRRFKLFTFSRLLGKVHVDRAAQQMKFTPPLSLVICSPVHLLVEEIGISLLKRGWVRLGGNILSVERVAVENQTVSEGEIVVQMLSPLVMYSTLNMPLGRYTYYYSPFEPRFQELILKNLSKKYQLIYGKHAEETPFEITPEQVGEKDFKILKYRDIVVKGWMGRYRLRGNPQLLEVGLEAGLGCKNSQGFGCSMRCDRREGEDA